MLEPVGPRDSRFRWRNSLVRSGLPSEFVSIVLRLSPFLESMFGRGSWSAPLDGSGADLPHLPDALQGG